jgi:hypothetical protein
VSRPLSGWISGAAFAHLPKQRSAKTQVFSRLDGLKRTARSARDNIGITFHALPYHVKRTLGHDENECLRAIASDH